MVRACLLSLSVFLLPVAAQRPIPDETPRPGLTLPTSKEFVSHLRTAEEHIGKEDWPVATTLLQRLLDRDDDQFIEVKRKGPDGKETTTIVSLRAEAGR